MRVRRRQRGGLSVEMLVHLVCAAALVTAFATLGNAFATDIAGSVPRAPSMSTSAQAGVATAAEGVARVAEEARVPRMLRAIRDIPATDFVDALAPLERGSRWSTVRPGLSPLGDAAWMVEDYLRDVLRVAGPRAIAPSSTDLDRIRTHGTASRALTTALMRVLRWTNDDYGKYVPTAPVESLALAAEMLAAEGKGLPDTFAAKLAVMEKIFTGGATPKEIRGVYGPNVRILRPKRFLPADHITRHLPEPGGTDWDRFVQLLRDGIRNDRYAVIPTAQYLLPAVRRAMRKQFAAWEGYQYQVASREATMADTGRRRPWGYGMYPEELQVLDTFARWQADLVHAAFPKTPLEPSAVVVQVLDPNQRPIIYASELSEAGVLQPLPAGHFDPSPINATIDFQGPGSVVYPHERRSTRQRSRESRLTTTPGEPTPTADLVFFTGVDARKLAGLRRRGMVHGSPPMGPARTFVGTAFASP